eukprot:1151553-Pelagomonas_calceolata.AAC.3
MPCSQNSLQPEGLMSASGLVGCIPKVGKSRVCCGAGKARFALPGFKFNQMLTESRPELC